MKMNGSVVALALVLALVLVVNGKPLPLPHRDIPEDVDIKSGGRSSVHGWLWLPVDQTYDPKGTIKGYWSHHTPEFPKDSPHDFQIVVYGEFTPATPLPALPYPPASIMVGTEFTFTPPQEFSLNDFINYDLPKLTGNYWNGSFATPYERKLLTSGSWAVHALNTVHYLDPANTEYYPTLPYLSYPRNQTAVKADMLHFYFVHLIHMQPDFNHIVHAIAHFPDCDRPYGDETFNDMQSMGATWEVMEVNNTLSNRLKNDRYEMELITNTASSGMICIFQVIEQIHCTTGPMFQTKCP